MSLRQLRARLNRLKAQFPEGDEESMARARQKYLYRRLLAGGFNAHTKAEAKEYDDLWLRFRAKELAERAAEGFKRRRKSARKRKRNPGCDSRRRRPLLRG